jgi:GT2 family glycosyltransferase
VLESATQTPREIVVVDDASPEAAISAWLRELASRGLVTLIAHPSNRGFIASVNEGMALHPDRDVVLLNSDTEVAPGWLDRLAGHARGDPSIGTATPFSNNATICSYPHPHVANPLPPGETTATLVQAFARANPRLSADIPTAVGFCMFISRRCLGATGPFDEARYGTGYGEEVDFCMRAARAGFRNVAAGDVFVRHVGEDSFRGAGEPPREGRPSWTRYRNSATLAQFLKDDPVKPYRIRVDEAGSGVNAQGSPCIIPTTRLSAHYPNKAVKLPPFPAQQHLASSPRA